jgi:dTDP-4-dehydrorhamnose reductase
VEKTKKILVTGAKGMLGSALCDVLGNYFDVLGIDTEECDITIRDKVKEKMQDLTIDAVIHCAAYTEVDKAEDESARAFLINMEGTKNILESVKNKNCLFIYISSDYVFDGQKESTYTELDSPNPLSVYGNSKLEGEKVVRTYDKHFIIRTGWLFGPKGKNFVATIIRLTREKETIEVVNDQVGSPTYTLHLAKAIKDMLDIYFSRGLEYGVYNITNSGKCSWFEFAQHISQLINSKAEIKPISSSQLKRKAKRPKNSLLSNEKFNSLIGYYLPSWQEALEDYLKKQFNQ